MDRSIKVAGNCNPICFLPNGLLLCYKYGHILLFNGNHFVEDHLVFSNFRERIVSRDRILSRALRLGIRTGLAINNEIVLVSISNVIYEYNVKTKTISQGFCLKERIRPLSFTEIFNIGTFEDGIVFGGYLVNPNKKAVNIYRRKAIDSWEIVYTFKDGEVNHIHNIVPDPYNDCVWVLTGDSEDSAAIWKATDDFQTVQCVKFGSQAYRACVAFATEDGLLYATDSPNDQNFIKILKKNGAVEDITGIAGSCIYGCRWGNHYVFSTSVEPDSTIKRSRVAGLLNRKKGPGINDYYSHIYMGTPEQGFSDIHTAKKDIFPYSFQLGTIMFPSGKNESSSLYYHPVAVTNDCSLMSLSQ